MMTAAHTAIVTGANHGIGAATARALAGRGCAVGTRSFFQTFCGMAREGRCDHRGQPPLLQVAASAPLWQMYLASPLVPVQQVVMAALRPLAIARGYRARYPRFEQE